MYIIAYKCFTLYSDTPTNSYRIYGKSYQLVSVILFQQNAFSTLWSKTVDDHAAAPAPTMKTRQDDPRLDEHR